MLHTISPYAVLRMGNYAQHQHTSDIYESRSAQPASLPLLEAASLQPDTALIPDQLPQIQRKTHYISDIQQRHQSAVKRSHALSSASL